MDRSIYPTQTEKAFVRGQKPNTHTSVRITYTYFWENSTLHPLSVRRIGLIEKYCFSSIFYIQFCGEHESLEFSAAHPSSRNQFFKFWLCTPIPARRSGLIEKSFSPRFIGIPSCRIGKSFFPGALLPVAINVLKIKFIFWEISTLLFRPEGVT